MSKLRERREALGLRREDVASRAGVSIETVRRFEASPDDANPTLEVARKIAGVLGSTVEKLFPAEETTTAGSRGR